MQLTNNNLKGKQNSRKSKEQLSRKTVRQNIDYIN
jgi:hypothetical protein